jgi:hypothetical protein
LAVVRDDMFKGLKIMSLGVINHGMSLSVLYILSYYKTIIINIEIKISQKDFRLVVICDEFQKYSVNHNITD